MTGMNFDKPIKLIIFDMDGVLADTTRGHKLAWQEYLSRYNRHLTDAEFKSFYGSSNDEINRTLFPDRRFEDAEFKMMSDEKEAMFRESARGNIQTYPGFFELLDLCDEQGITKVVGSSAIRENVDFVLKELNITDRFAATVSSDDVVNAKPSPDIFLKTLSLTGIPAEFAMVIEDSIIGINAAVSAGIRVAALTTTHGAEELGAADLIVKDFLELISQTSLGTHTLS